MLVRPEKQEEFPYLYDFIRTAFATARVSDGSEPDFVDVLREGVNYIPELALVAEKEGKIIGHILFTRTYLSIPGGRSEALLLAPVAIATEKRDKGMGAALIREGMSRAKGMGFRAVFDWRSGLLRAFRLCSGDKLRYPAQRRHPGKIFHGSRTCSRCPERHQGHH